MLKIGMISYINALPYYAAFEKGVLSINGKFEFGVPSKLNHALREGELDISLISSAEYLQSSEYLIFPNFCIGAREKVESVCVYIRGSISDLDGKSLALTTQSATSVQLIKILCNRYWNVSPNYIPLPEKEKWQENNAFLLIGDECLENQTFPGYTTIDLAQAWYYATGLPFTFAVFAIRKKIFNDRVDEILEIKSKFEQALQWAKQNPEVIEQMAMEKCRLPVEVIRNYYRLLHYELTPQHRLGLEKFEQLQQPVNR